MSICNKKCRDKFESVIQTGEDAVGKFKDSANGYAGRFCKWASSREEDAVKKNAERMLNEEREVFEALNRTDGERLDVLKKNIKQSIKEKRSKKSFFKLFGVTPFTSSVIRPTVPPSIQKAFEDEWFNGFTAEMRRDAISNTTCGLSGWVVREGLKQAENDMFGGPLSLYGIIAKYFMTLVSFFILICISFANIFIQSPYIAIIGLLFVWMILCQCRIIKVRKYLKIIIFEPLCISFIIDAVEQKLLSEGRTLTGDKKEAEDNGADGTSGKGKGL